MDTIIKFGYELGYTAFNTRDMSVLDRYIEQANSDDAEVSKRGKLILGGAVSTLITIANDLDKAGVINLTGPMPSAAALTYGLNHEPQLFNGIVNATLRTTAKIMSIVAPAITVSKAEKAEAVSPAPIPVTVQSLPVREQITKVARDDKGNIISTVQVAYDAEAVQ
jgi:hypothetical protein